MKEKLAVSSLLVIVVGCEAIRGNGGVLEQNPVIRNGNIGVLKVSSVIS